MPPLIDDYEVRGRPRGTLSGPGGSDGMSWTVLGWIFCPILSHLYRDYTISYYFMLPFLQRVIGLTKI